MTWLLLHRRGLGALALVAALLLAAGCTLAPAQKPAPHATIHFMAGYKPQANLPFVGVYLAQANGYFAEQGLDVEIQHSSGQGEHLKLVLQGAVDVTTAEADATLARRAESLPVVSFAVIGQRGSRAFATLASSDVRSLKDWEGRLVGYKVYPTPDYLALLAMNGVDRGKIQEVPVGFDPRLLAAGKVDVYPVFESNEPDTLERLGVPVRLFRPADFGVPSLGLTYLTRQQLLDSSPELLARFLKAALRGIAFARENPEAATDVVMRFAPEEDRAHQLAMLKVELDMADSPITRQKGIGWSDLESWQAFHDSLLAFDGLKKPVDVKTAFSDKMLSLVYQNGQLQWP